MTHDAQIPQDAREALAMEEVGHTQVSRGGIAALVIAFALIVLLVPAVQLVSEWRRGETVSQWGLTLPQSVAVLHLAPQASELADAARNGSVRGAIRSLRATNRRMLRDIKAYEEGLEKNSRVVALTIPPAQTVLTGWLRAGNENAICGREGWLFYRPDVDYATRPGFLEARVLAARAKSGNEFKAAPEPDPVPAIMEFARALKGRGIELIVMPAASKATVHPEKLSGIYASADRPIQNPSFDEFQQRLAAEGVRVFDPAPALAAHGDSGAYLKTDTHWTPEAMQAAAKRLAEVLTSDLNVARGDKELYRARAKTITNTGDVAAMLKLPNVEQFYPKETVTIRPIEDESGAAWKPDAAAEVLFLGDSFSNIYSLGPMGWGESAGFAEQLSFELQRPVDSIRMNDNGSYATRRELDRDLRDGNDRLAGKRVVIWEFASRELAIGDWKTGFTYTASQAAPNTSSSGLVTERGTVQAIAKMPAPGSVPYRDCIIAVHLTQLTDIARFPNGDALVFVWGMVDNQLQPAANWRAGDTVSLALRPWNGVSAQYGSFNRIELDDDALLTLEPYWGEAPGTTAKAPSQAPMQTAQASPATSTPAPAPAGSATAESFAAELAKQVETLTAADQVALRGADGWLFFRPELRHLSVGAFWGDAAKAVSRADNPAYADPLAAIVDFNEQCKSEGIKLILAPVPPKAVVYPDKLSTSVSLSEGKPPRLDATLQQFYSALRERGVEVLDLTDAMLASRSAGLEMFCKQDTHYSGDAVALFAREIAKRLSNEPWIAGVPKSEFRETERTQEIRGDLWKFLTDASLAKEQVRLHVVETTGPSPAPAEPWRESPVLLLGDSHCLVFHEGGDMHAAGAGLPDVLAKELGFPVDLVGVRGSGATPARMNLMRRRDNLVGKKAVVWCFTAREFTEAPGGWRPLPVIQPR